MAAQLSLFDILLDQVSELEMDDTADLLIIADAPPALLHDDGRVELIPGTAPAPRALLEESITEQWGLSVEVNHPYDVEFVYRGVAYHVLIHDDGDELLSVSLRKLDAVPAEPSVLTKVVRSLRNVKPKAEAK